MHKVFQTIVDKENGNCMQAAVASLLDMELEEVPHFLELAKEKDTNPNFEEMKFMHKHGYGYCVIDHKYDSRIGESIKNPIENLKEYLKYDGGVNGYFYASVKSQTFDDIFHAVIIDSDLNIVHDPNPNQLALKLKPEDIYQVQTNKEGLHIGINGEIVEAIT